MDRKAKVELFEQIRREYNFGEGSTVRGIARQFNVHRRMVRQAIATAIPPERKVSDRAHIIETGSESYRFRRTLENHHRVTARAPAKPLQTPPDEDDSGEVPT